MNDGPPPKTHAADAKPQRPSVSPTWRWRTFPVFAAFVAGLLIASVVNRETDSAIEGVVQIAALVGASYVLIHLFVMNVLVAGRIRRRTERTLRGEEPEELFEDVAVYDAKEDE
jgi:hypothetical protein